MAAIKLDLPVLGGLKAQSNHPFSNPKHLAHPSRCHNRTPSSSKLECDHADRATISINASRQK
ncbi:hypothetical protein IEQ34_001055 [Dendrobium chrysotoxum]|uniref:Uncharacterized protein n=1 Tax=Dendrobium chrysotoxum TaxID=161865 RepID=A0AAV7HKP7_DENCH|nr:hypothetical protein IEQ34_001055 [Dendrobium chrysotoxum]